MPGGKVNQNESGKDAAARETYEETGFDPDSEKGVCFEWKGRLERGEVVEELLQNNGGDFDQDEQDLLPWKPLRDEDKFIYTEKDSNKRRTCYVCRGVPESFPFEPVARKEVAEVAWHDFNSLPKNHYGVLPFMGQLKRWIKRDNKRRGIKNRDESRAGSRSNNNKTPMKQNDARKGSTSRQGGSSNKKQRDGSRGKNSSRSGSRGREVHAGDKLIESGLATPGDTDRWAEEDMFATNEKILGKKYTYDGNPHDFAEKGFNVEGSGRVDPHHFRVVGGGFMNSDGAALSAPPPASAMQPLVNRSRSQSGASKYSGGGTGADDDGEEDDELEFTPFFSDDGKAPWEEEGGIMSILPPFEDNSQEQGNDNSLTPPPVQAANSMQSNTKGLTLLSKLRQGMPVKTSNDTEGNNLNAATGPKASKKTKNAEKTNSKKDDWFLTDKEITAKSQKQKLNAESIEERDNEHLVWMKQWAQGLPQAPPTKEFGNFKFNVEAIMKAMVA